MDKHKITVVGVPVQKVVEAKMESLFSNAQSPTTGDERVPLSSPFKEVVWGQRGVVLGFLGGWGR